MAGVTSSAAAAGDANAPFAGVDAAFWTMAGLSVVAFVVSLVVLRKPAPPPAPDEVQAPDNEALSSKA